MAIKEITASELNPEQFIEEKCAEIREAAGDGIVINALSGGVDSSTATMLGHRALGNNLETFFIKNGLMRSGERKKVVEIFAKLGVPVQVINAQDEFFSALEGVTDPEEKREAITQTFYKKVFVRLVKALKAKILLQGTILTDIDETVAGIKRQHNVFKQIGIDPEEAFGYQIIEPLIQLRKDGVRLVAKALGLPEEIYNRPPFPGPALATRVIGPVTKKKIEIIRQATTIMEEVFENVDSFQNMAILHEDRVTGIVEGKGEFGRVIQIRCWQSVDARTATQTELPWDIMKTLDKRIITEVPGVVQTTMNLTDKPPVTMEAL